MSNITSEIRDFADRFASHIESEDYSDAHAMLAPWLQDVVSPDALQEEIETELRATASGFDIDDLIYPDGHHLDSGVLSYEDLRGAGTTRTPVPAELTADNFVLWMVIEFLSDDDDLEIDAWFDMWFAVVRHEGSLAIGYYEIGEAD